MLGVFFSLIEYGIAALNGEQKFNIQIYKNVVPKNINRA